MVGQKDDFPGLNIHPHSLFGNFLKVFGRPKDITDFVYKFAILATILDAILNFQLPLTSYEHL